MAVDGDGRMVASARPTEARSVDWEALERADCRDGGSCLWVADTGDNRERRSDPILYRMMEPALEATAAVGAQTFPIRLPDGPRDVEALFVLPGEAVHLVTKGRNHPATVYRYPPPLRPGKRVTLERVQSLGEAPRRLPRQVTGAATSPDGRMVAVRTYETLRFYRVRSGPGPHPEDAPRRADEAELPAGLLLAPVPGGEVNLRPLREAQGEAVGWAPDGRIVLTSEAGPGGRRGGLRTLRCEEVDGR